MSARAEAISLTPSALVELYELDTTPTGSADVFRFSPHGPNELGQDIVWAGQTYVRLPIEAQGFEWRGNGTLPRPTVRVANVSGLLGAIAEDLIGARLIRTRVFTRHLDAANFTAGNPQADPNQWLDREVWFIDRKAVENNVLVEFELASSFDLSGVTLPRRQFLRAYCPWRYRGPDCGYTGPAVADVRDQPTTDPDQDRCGKRLRSCQLRFGEHAPLPFGGFPGVGLAR